MGEPNTDSLEAKEAGESIWMSYRLRDRTLLTIGALAAYGIFAGVAELFAIPRVEGFQGSLLAQPASVLALLVAGVVLIACVTLISPFAGIVRFEAGLYCAAIGMIALSIRGGPMRYVLMASPGDGIFLKLIVELLVLFAFVGASWAVMMVLSQQGVLRPEPH